jgi:cytochrome d ubiquinol oxidase subunit II
MMIRSHHFLWVALLLYLVMGGADFGAGIIEMFTSNKNKIAHTTIMYNAIGPIWEANHMWLIIAIVILFVGFPVIYATMSPTCTSRLRLCSWGSSPGALR